MRIATWNVNSLNIRLPQVLRWLSEQTEAGRGIDVLCLQELKQVDEKFPLKAFDEIGYHAAFFGQKTYNGVAILSRHPLSEVVKNNPTFSDEQSRLISATVNVEGLDYRVISAYVPNGQSVGSDKYHYKLRWLKACHAWLSEELKRYPRLAIVGDFNVAPSDLDVHNPELWAGSVLVSPEEREAFASLCALPLTDSFRTLYPETQQFTWWDYRAGAFRRNHGARIDHILLSVGLRASECQLDAAPRGWEQASDHAPLWADITAV